MSVDESCATSWNEKSERRKATRGPPSRSPSAPASAVDRAPRGDDGGAAAGARAVERRRRPRRARSAGRRAGRRNRVRHVRCSARRLVNFDGHLVISESRSPTNVPCFSSPGDDHLAPLAERVGHDAGVGDGQRLVGRRGRGSGRSARRRPCRPSRRRPCRSARRSGRARRPRSDRRASLACVEALKLV